MHAIISTGMHTSESYIHVQRGCLCHREVCRLYHVLRKGGPWIACRNRSVHVSLVHVVREML